MSKTDPNQSTISTSSTYGAAAAGGGGSENLSASVFKSTIIDVKSSTENKPSSGATPLSKVTSSGSGGSTRPHHKSHKSRSNSSSSSGSGSRRSNSIKQKLKSFKTLQKQIKMPNVNTSASSSSSSSSSVYCGQTSSSYCSSSYSGGSSSVSSAITSSISSNIDQETSPVAGAKSKVTPKSEDKFKSNKGEECNKTRQQQQQSHPPSPTSPTPTKTSPHHHHNPHHQQQQPHNRKHKSSDSRNQAWNPKFTLESKLSESFRKNRENSVKLKFHTKTKSTVGEHGSVFQIQKVKADDSTLHLLAATIKDDSEEVHKEETEIFVPGKGDLRCTLPNP